MIELNVAALRRIGLTHPIAARLAAHERGLPARVTSVHRASLLLHDGDGYDANAHASYWKVFPTTHEAEDAAAQAFADLPPELQAAFLNPAVPW